MHAMNIVNDMAVSRSREYIVLQKNQPLLALKAEECLQELTRAVFDGGLISEQTSRECSDESASTDGRAQTLMDALLDKVGEEETCFDVLVTVLRRIPVMTHVGNKLEDEYRTELGGFRVPPNSGGGFGRGSGGEDLGDATVLQDMAVEGDSGFGRQSNTNLLSESAPSIPADTSAAFGDSQLPNSCDTDGALVSQSERLIPERPSLPQQATDGDDSPLNDRRNQVVLPPSTDSLNTRVMNLAAELSEKNVQLESLKADFDSVTQEKQLLEQDVKMAQKQIERMEARRASEVERLEGQIEGLIEEIKEKDNQLDNLKERISQVEVERGKLKREQEKLESEVRGTTRDMELRMRRLEEEQKEENSAHKQEEDKLKRERDQFRHERDKVATEKDDLLCRFDQLECHNIFTYRLLYCVLAFFVVLGALLVYADLYGRFFSP